jgi:hypothetical protein
MTYKNGVHIESDLNAYQADAIKFRKLLALAKEENTCRSRIKAIGQERAKVYGFTHKYYKE